MELDTSIVLFVVNVWRVSKLVKVEHKISIEMVREVAKNLYKHPMSAVRELITNALDEQSSLPYKDQKVEIFTHVGPDNDMVIEDPARGIIDMDKFLESGTGTKKGLKDKAGFKGMGKLGSSIISGASPVPIVIWYSHRPRTNGLDGEVLKAQGAIVKLSDWVEYDVEYVDTTEAKPEPGCRVVIKNCKYNKLPPESKFIKYIADTYAIRITDGTKILLDGNPISKPEGFNATKHPLLTLDNDEIVYGNSRANDKTEGDNVTIFIKDILVEKYKIDNLCEIFINDDLLVPTSSRESVVGDERYEKIKIKIQKYADEHYPKPIGPQVGDMGRQKDKNALMLAALQYRNRLLSGEYDPNGIPGNITGGMGHTWIRKKAVLINTDGNDPCGVSNGPGKKGPGHGIPDGDSGPKQGYQLDGDHDIAINNGNDQQDKEGLIKPTIIDLPYDHGQTKPMCWIDGMTIHWNTGWRATQRGWNEKGKDWGYYVAPLYAQALANADKEEYEQFDWEQRYMEYYQFLIMNSGCR